MTRPKDSPQDAIYHDTNMTEILYILEGSANLITGGTIPEDRLRTFIREGNRMIDYLAARTHLRFDSLEFYPDYVPEDPGGRLGGRSLDPVPFDGNELGEEFRNTVFSDEATATIGSGTAPFTGTFRPDSPLSVMDGLSTKGTWTLEVLSLFGGTIENWSMIVVATPPRITVGDVSIAGLSDSSARVAVWPPLFWSGPSLGSMGLAEVPTWSPFV